MSLCLEYVTLRVVTNIVPSVTGEFIDINYRSKKLDYLSESYIVNTVIDLVENLLSIRSGDIKTIVVSIE